MDQSKLIESLKQARFLFDNIRLYGEKEVTQVIRIFTASLQGWTAKDFHSHCDNKGPTLCLLRSSENYLAAGFTSKNWTSKKSPVIIKDSSAMVFALSNALQVFKSNNPKQALCHYEGNGPIFGRALAIWTTPMNKINGGESSTQGLFGDEFGVVED